MRRIAPFPPPPLHTSEHPHTVTLARYMLDINHVSTILEIVFSLPLKALRQADCFSTKEVLIPLTHAKRAKGCTKIFLNLRTFGEALPLDLTRMLTKLYAKGVEQCLGRL